MQAFNHKQLRFKKIANLFGGIASFGGYRPEGDSGDLGKKGLAIDFYGTRKLRTRDKIAVLFQT